MQHINGLRLRLKGGTQLQVHSDMFNLGLSFILVTLFARLAGASPVTEPQSTAATSEADRAQRWRDYYLHAMNRTTLLYDTPSDAASFSSSAELEDLIQQGDKNSLAIANHAWVVSDGANVLAVASPEFAQTLTNTLFDSDLQERDHPNSYKGAYGFGRNTDRCLGGWCNTALDCIPRNCRYCRWGQNGNPDFCSNNGWW